MTTAIKYPHAAGFVAGDRPKIVTSRFEHADSYTIERFLATGGYAGLRKALGRAATDVHEEVKSATVLGRGGAGFPATQLVCRNASCTSAVRWRLRKSVLRLH